MIISGTPGDQLVVLSLPFGSFVPDQPPAPVVVSASVSNKAKVGNPLPIQAQAVFAVGDQPIVTPGSGSVLGSTVETDKTPALLHLTKTYLGPENETATGPNFPQQYRIDVAVAPGQTVHNLEITDQLPPNLQFQSVVSTTPASTASPRPPRRHLAER